MKHIYRRLSLLCFSYIAVSSSLALGQQAAVVNSISLAGDWMKASPHLISEPANSQPIGCDIHNVAAHEVPLCGGCRPEGIFFSAEVGFLEVTQSGRNNLAARLLELQNPAAPPSGSLASGPDATPRFTVGYQSFENLGVRARIWDFDQAVIVGVPQTAPGTPNFITQAWDITVFDLEAIKAFSNPVWDVTPSLGYRILSYRESASTLENNAQQSSVNSKFLGNGFTSAVDLRRHITPRFSLMANPRCSVLLGNQSTTPEPAPVINTYNPGFDVRYIVESQIGATFERQMLGGWWFFRTGYEIQYWNDFSAPIGNQADASWTMFNGFFVAAGFQR